MDAEDGCVWVVQQVSPGGVGNQGAYPGQLGGLAYGSQQYASAAGQQAQMSAAPFTSQQPLSNSYYAQY